MKQDMINKTMTRHSGEYPRCWQGVAKVLAYSMSMVRVWLEYACTMPKVWLDFSFKSKTLFNRCKLRVSYPLAVTFLPGKSHFASGKRPLSSLESHSPLASFCRYAAVVLLMMVGGVTGAWGKDYSGFWYSQNKKTAGHYLVPAADPQQNPPIDVYYDAYDANNSEPYSQPFLTTFKTGKDDNSIWYITPVEGESDYYHIKHCKTNKYVVYSVVLPNVDGGRRKYVHLEEEPTLTDDKTKFKIKKEDNSVYIIITPKSSSLSQNVAGGPKDSYHGEAANYFNGLVGGMNGTDDGSRWSFEDALPSISYQSNNKIKITFVDENAIIYYTTDNTDPTTSGTRSTLSETHLLSLTDVTSIKAVAYVDGIYSGITSSTYIPISSDNSYLLQSVDCTDFYMTVGDLSGTNTTVNTSSQIGRAHV